MYITSFFVCIMSKKEADLAIYSPGLMVVAKPILTISYLNKKPRHTCNEGQCYVCGMKTTRSDIHIENISFHESCKNKLYCPICNELMLKKFCIENGIMMHTVCHHHIFSHRCFTCNEQTNGSDLIIWNGYHFHEKCFICSLCHLQITSKEETHSLNGLPICGICYSQRAKICINCNKLVEKTKKNKFLFGGRVFFMHDCCSFCFECNQKLTKNNFAFEQNKAICRICWMKSLSYDCQKCNEPILSHNLIFYRNYWHNKCIECTKCHQNMRYSHINLVQSQIFCDECFKGLKTHCGVCGQVIENEGIECHERVFHYQCYKCCICQATLNESNSEYLNGKLYCSSCIHLKNKY